MFTNGLRQLKNKYAQANKRVCVCVCVRVCVSKATKCDKRRKYLPKNIEILRDLIANNPQIVNFKPRKRLCA